MGSGDAVKGRRPEDAVLMLFGEGPQDAEDDRDLWLERRALADEGSGTVRLLECDVKWRLGHESGHSNVWPVSG